MQGERFRWTTAAVLIAVLLAGCHVAPTAPVTHSRTVIGQVSVIPDPVVEPRQGGGDLTRVFIGAMVAAPHFLTFTGHREGSDVVLTVTGVVGHGDYQQAGGWHVTATLGGNRHWLVTEGDVAGYAKHDGVPDARVIDLYSWPDFTSPSAATITGGVGSATIRFPATYLNPGDLAWLEIHDITATEGLDHDSPIGTYVRP